MKLFKKTSALVSAVGLVVVIAAGAITIWAQSAWQNERRERAGYLTGGNAARGKVAIDRYGCAACHIIPGIRGQRTSVAPSLEDISQRTYIAGVIENKPENMVNWIVNPPAIDPKTAMPRLGVSPEDARDIAAYLYSNE